MSKTAHFTVDPRLATLLGENYRSSEQALMELIDNAWDANADNVWVELRVGLGVHHIRCADQQSQKPA